MEVDLDQQQPGVEAFEMSKTQSSLVHLAWVSFFDGVPKSWVPDSEIVIWCWLHLLLHLVVADADTRKQ